MQTVPKDGPFKLIFLSLSAACEIKKTPKEMKTSLNSKEISSSHDFAMKQNHFKYNKNIANWIIEWYNTADLILVNLIWVYLIHSKTLPTCWSFKGLIMNSLKNIHMCTIQSRNCIYSLEIKGFIKTPLTDVKLP